MTDDFDFDFDVDRGRSASRTESDDPQGAGASTDLATAVGAQYVDDDPVTAAERWSGG